MTLAMAAHVCLTVVRARELDAEKAENGSSQLIHLSLAEIRRLITRLADRRPTPVSHILHWSRWRRRRQYQAHVSEHRCSMSRRVGRA
ncbi:hypothetical protein SANTM175S_05559 [Streptomyces antimycoticus]